MLIQFDNTMGTKAFAVSILFILSAGLGHQDTTLCGDRGVQVCPPSTSPFGDCICSVNVQCSWISFANPYKRLSNVSSAPLLMWNESMGYGQFMCIEDNLTADYPHQHVVRTILILPEGKH